MRTGKPAVQLQAQLVQLSQETIRRGLNHPLRKYQCRKKISAGSGTPPPGLLRSHTMKAKETTQLVGHCKRANKLGWAGKYYAQVSAPVASHPTVKP